MNEKPSKVRLFYTEVVEASDIVRVLFGDKTRTLLYIISLVNIKLFDYIIAIFYFF